MDPRTPGGEERGADAESEEQRRLALERLVALEPESARAALAAGLGDPSWRVRKAAVEALASLPEPWRAAPLLIEALADGENPGRRNSAVEALVNCGAAVVEPLIEAARSSDADVRKLAVDALAGIGSEDAAESLLPLLADPDPNVRGAVADALGALGGEGAAAALVRVAACAEEDALVRFSALRALARLEAPVPAAQLGDALEDPWLRPAAFALLAGGEDAESVEMLLKGLADGARATREAAMAGLVRRVAAASGLEAVQLVDRVRSAAAAAPAWLPDALQRLAAGDLALRLVLLQFLGLLRRGDTALAILQAARDEALCELALETLASFGADAERALDEGWEGLDTESRRLACGVLGSTAGEGGALRLLGALDAPEPALRAAAAEALGRRRCLASLPGLLRRLEAAAGDAEGEEELGAISAALVALGQPAPGAGVDATARLVEELAARLEHPCEPVRLVIARVLGRVGRTEDERLVTLLLKDPSGAVRRAAVEALARLEPEAAPEPVRLALADECALVRIAAAAALGASTSPLALLDLARLAEDGEVRVRAAAVRALGRHAAAQADPHALAALEAAVRDEPEVALAAAESLRAVGGEAALRVARSLLRHPEPEVVQAALACLGDQAPAVAVEELLPLVFHPHWAVRADVIRLLSQRGDAKAAPALRRRLELENDDFVRAALEAALGRLGSQA